MKFKVTVGLWWRWQDLNLLPWDYDSLAQYKNRLISQFFLYGVKIKVKILGKKINIFLSKSLTRFFQFLSRGFKLFIDLNFSLKRKIIISSILKVL